MMRKFDLVWGAVRRPVFVVRTDTVLLFSLPAKVYPCAAVIQISRFWVRSAGLSEDGAAATQQEPSADETALAFASFPPEKRDIKSDNMSASDFMIDKDNAFSCLIKAAAVLLDCLGIFYTAKLDYSYLLSFFTCSE